MATGPQPKVVHMHQMSFSFNFEESAKYMRKYIALDEARTALNVQFSTIREDAHKDNIPTKAVEAAVRAAKGRRNSAISETEFEALMDEAEAQLKTLDAK